MVRRNPDEWSKDMIERKRRKRSQLISQLDERVVIAKLMRAARAARDPSLVKMLKLVARRERLKAEHIACPACGERHQVQLVDWLAKPASWKCRICKHTFKSDGQ